MTKEECVNNLREIVSDMPSDECADWIEAVLTAIEALQQEPCEEYISRNAIIEYLQRILSASDINSKYNEGFASGLEFCISNLTTMPSVQPKQKTGHWIPVSESLPKEYGEYICTMSNGDVQECGFVPSGEKGLITGWSTCEADGFKKLDYQDVIAWMPLPEPYKEKMQ